MPAFAPGVQTTDAAQVEYNLGVTVPPDSLSRVPVYVFASDHDGDVSVWFFRVAMRRVGDATPGVVFNTPERQNSAGALLWTATVAINSSGQLVARLTGALARTIDWLIVNDDAFTMEGPFAG
jgi:hypothetical protein